MSVHVVLRIETSRTNRLMMLLWG